MSASTPAPTVAASPGPSPVAAPPFEDSISDRGVVRRDRVRAGRWELSGIGKVLGEVDATTVRAKGTLVVGGAFAAETTATRGTLDVSGPVQVRSSLTVDGSFRAGAAVRASVAELVGTAKVVGELRVDRLLTVRGSLSAPSIQAGEFSMRGDARVPGKLAAHRVSADLVGDSAFGEIEAASLRMVGRSTRPIAALLGPRTVVTVDRIEADAVELTAVDVGFVRAKSIVLGRDAHVRDVEGTIVRAHPSSRVGPESRSLPPPGLSR